MKRIKGSNNSKDRFKILSWNPLENYKKKEGINKEDAKLNALRKVIEKGTYKLYLNIY